MKIDNIDFSHFEHTSAAPRVHCRMTPFGPHAYMPSSGPVPEGYYPRGNTINSYAVPQSRYYGVAPFPDYPEESVNVDYGVQQAPSYSMLATENLVSSSFPPPSGRGWTSTSQMAKNGPMYLEHDPSYSHGQLLYHSAYQIHPTISPEPKSSINSLSVPLNINVSSLPPPPVSGTGRILPYPANRTALPLQGGSYNRSTAASSLPAPQPEYQSSDGLMSSNTLNTVKTVSTSAVPSTSPVPAETYLPYTSSSPDSLASTAQTAYSTQHLPQSQSELYTSSNDGLYQHNESSESSYGPSSSDKRNSHSSQIALSPEISVPSMSSGTLSNGHAYIPYNSASTYPAPPMDIPAPTPSRQVSSTLAAGISTS